MINTISYLTQKINNFINENRFKYTKRSYDCDSIIKLNGGLNFKYPSSDIALTFYNQLRDFQKKKKYSLTFGCLDPIQVVQTSKYLTSIYISGWQCSSTASSSNEPGPDLADYPMNTVLNFL